ncbi:THAP-type domain-containing protein [Camponotus japonicus]
MPGCVALNCSNLSENGFLLFSIPTNVERRKKWLQSLRREQWIPTKSACVCEVHFDDSQFENRRADGWKKLKPNAVPTIFDVHNSPLRIDPPPKKSLNKKPEQDEVAATCVQEVAEVPIIPEMNIDYAAPSNHDVFNEVESSQKDCCHLTASRLLEKTKK